MNSKMNNKKQQIQQMFSQYADAYVQDAVHAQGASLGRLMQALALDAGASVLDIATGGGHSAAAAAQAGARVIASDLTLPIMVAARQHYARVPLQFVQHSAEALPYPANSFDLITCRNGAHHFTDVAAFVQACSRVLKPGGVLGIVDIISSEQARIAHYCNAFESLRDPSHVWAYALPDWELFFHQAGLQLQQRERLGLEQRVGEWGRRVGCDPATLQRLRVMLLQAPRPVREWYRVQMQPGEASLLDVTFHIQQALLVAQKPPAG